MAITLLSLFKAIILPPTSLMLLALAGLLYPRRSFGILVTRLSLMVLLLLSLPAVVGQSAQRWEQHPPLQASDIQQFKPQALVVIGGGAFTGAEEYQSSATVNTRTLLRLRYAAKLWNEIHLPILVSGGKFSDVIDVSEAELMAAVLVDEFKASVAWVEGKSRNTFENAQFSHILLKEAGVNRIVLVTQAYHMPRAAKLFQQMGFSVLPAPTAFIGQTADFTMFDFIPSTTAWMNSFLLAYESLAMVWYQISS